MVTCERFLMDKVVMLPPIKGFINNSLIEWEGKIVSVIFLPGCNLRCAFCHAKHLLASQSNMETIPFESIEESICNGKGWLDGVVISGGEPTIHEELPRLMERLKSTGVLVKLDTNGTNPAVLKDLISGGLVDAVSMDVKAPLDERYEAITVWPVEQLAVYESIMALIESEIDYEFRTTVCPSFHDEKDIIDIARTLRGARQYVLQQFKPVNCLDSTLEEVEPYPVEQLRIFAKKAEKFVATCRVRGEVQEVVALQVD